MPTMKLGACPHACGDPRALLALARLVQCPRPVSPTGLGLELALLAWYPAPCPALLPALVALPTPVGPAGPADMPRVVPRPCLHSTVSFLKIPSLPIVGVSSPPPPGSLSPPWKPALGAL